ncbi:MAG: HD domain-containing protein [Candidatus Fermentibacteraceae bacterium]
MMMYENLRDRFIRAGFRLYIVGGFVRDRLLGIPPGGDTDLSTDAVPERVRSLLEEAGFGVLDMGVEFGTLTARDGETGEMCEITTLRTGERYFPGSRHPKVTFGSDISDDLSRRDFTVNAMALDENGALIDPLGGERDLGLKLLRTPGDPGVSFREDPLRILRAFRFMATLGFSIEDATADALRRHASELVHVAAERKLKEMNLLFQAPGGNLPGTLNAMLETGVLLQLLPELSGLASLRGAPQGRHHNLDAWEHTLLVVSHTPPDPVLRWAALFHDSGKGSAKTLGADGQPHFHDHERAGSELAATAAESMRFSRAWRRALEFLVQNHMRPVLYRSDWSDGAVRRLAGSAGENLDRLLALTEADIRSKAPETVREGLESLAELRKRLENTPVEKRLLAKGTGKVVREALGLSGKRLAEAVGKLEEAVLSGELQPQPDPELCVRFLSSSFGGTGIQGP